LLIQTSDIRVDYGQVKAVSDLTLSIDPGEIFGLIGPNGAGKTSLIRVLATISEPTHGQVSISGFDIFSERAQARRQIGYMPDLAPVFKDLRCWEFLDLFAASYSIPRRERRACVDRCLDIVNLNSKRTAMAGTLSRGMTQRLVLAKTMLHDPPVLLLDEPASGLDPIARVDLRNLLRDLAARGKTVLISSHILNELSEFCTSIGIMEQGRLVLSGSIDEIDMDLNTHRRFTLETVGPAKTALTSLQQRDGISEVVVSGDKCDFETTMTDEQIAELLADLVRSSLPIKAFHERRRGVEDLMIQIGATEVS
jgi:ABC-2 type transport system ATP-binding protein